MPPHAFSCWATSTTTICHVVLQFSKLWHRICVITDKLQLDISAQFMCIWEWVPALNLIFNPVRKWCRRHAVTCEVTLPVGLGRGFVLRSLFGTAFHTSQTLNLVALWDTSLNFPCSQWGYTAPPHLQLQRGTIIKLSPQSVVLVGMKKLFFIFSPCWTGCP